MPITSDRPIQAMMQEQFGIVAFEVINHAFAIHREMGRLFEEEVYQNELCRRLGNLAGTEVHLTASFGDFRKVYRMDLLVDGGAVFEIKAVSELLNQHRTQLIHYLQMSGLNHGKLINFRGKKVQHEFVNSIATLAERQAFEIQLERWNRDLPGCQEFQDILTECLRDWGTGLELPLYGDAVTHFFGGKGKVEQEIKIESQGCRLGCQVMSLINPVTAFKLTSIQRDQISFEWQLRRFLQYATTLRHMLWVNITLKDVVFVLISKD